MAGTQAPEKLIKVGRYYMTPEELLKFRRWLKDLDDKVKSYERVVYEKGRRVY